MLVFINNNGLELPEQAKLADAMKRLNISSQRGVAIAINNTVVPKSEWETHVLQPEDRIIVIKATQGG